MCDIIRAECPAELERLISLSDRYFKPDVKPVFPGTSATPQEYSESHFARVALRRGDSVHVLSRLFSLTGQRRYRDDAVRLSMNLFDQLGDFPDEQNTGAFVWHPHSAEKSHDPSHVIERICHSLPYLRSSLSPDEALLFLKALLACAEFCFRTCKHEVMFNIPLHMLTSSLITGLLFPEFSDSHKWVAWVMKRLGADCTRRPFMSSDGYTGEGFSYHTVNLNLMTLCRQYILASGRRLPSGFNNACIAAFEFCTKILRNDGKYPLFADSGSHNSHEHHIHAHEILHLGCALFRRPDFKNAAGCPSCETPMERNVWLMGESGYQYWKSVISIPRDQRPASFHPMPATGFHFFGMGQGLDAHYGMLAAAPTHNHAHHDFASIDISGYGRPLLTDPGTPGYNVDDFRSDRAHNTSVLIRREPLGPRIDNDDHAFTVFAKKDTYIQGASVRHDLYENHRIRRSLFLVNLDHALDAAEAKTPRCFWLVLDRIDRLVPWNKGVTVPHDFIETFFHFHAPESELGRDEDTLTCWSKYAVPDTIRRFADTDIAFAQTPEILSRAWLHDALDITDSDANIQVTAIPMRNKHSIMDMRFFESATHTYGGRTPRPAVAYRFRGFLPFDSAFVLIPFRGVSESKIARVTGRWLPGRILKFAISTRQGAIDVTVKGISENRCEPSVVIKKTR
ncbi:MAG: heparinase II/III family protein [Planctomycetota bacterium]